MNELERYCIQWLWTAKRVDAGGWWVISHAAHEEEDKTPCGLDTTKGWWDGSGLSLVDGSPSCKKCLKALERRGIVPNLPGSGMVIQKTKGQ